MDDEDRRLRSVALQNANSILLARQRAEEELLETREALRRSQERLTAALTAAGTGTFRWNIQTDTVEWDGNLDRLFGLGPGQTVQSLEAFIAAVHPDDRCAVSDACARCARDGSDFDMEFRVVWPDGSVRWIADKAKAFVDAAGTPVYMTGACADITARKGTEAALRDLYEAAQRAAEERKALLESERAARAEAERMSNVKDEFLATLSHELRTPLNAILGWSQILRSGGHDRADFIKGIETIERNAHAQTKLIEDLLDMSRITSGKLRLDIRSIPAASFFDGALETVKPAADAKGITLEKMVEPSLGSISGDPSRLQQVIWNLLSNAIKFTPKRGTVRIEVQRVSSQVEIRVSDSGVGIRPEFIPHLFERFRQGDASTTRKYGGLGLGLSIVKSLVELHGGTVGVSSEGDGLGTTVTVHLPVIVVPPVATGDPLEAESAAPAEFAGELAGLTVLVVDDQADALELMKRVLEDSAALVTTASTTDEALRLVQTRRPDVLVTDIGMPEADGFELLSRVRALEVDRGGRIPAIAVTAFARSEDRTRALRAGFLAHISKPLDPSELVATVASVARRVGK